MLTESAAAAIDHTLCNRLGLACKGEDALRELGVLTAEVMTLANLHARGGARGQGRADGIRFAFAVDAQHRQRAERADLRARGGATVGAAHPVRDTDFEGSV